MNCPLNALSRTWHLPHTAQAACLAREYARKQLADWGLSSIANDVVLVVSELATNAFRHAAPPVTLSLASHRERVWGIVIDHSPPWLPQSSLVPDLDAVLAENGRGLMLVTAYTDRWGVLPRAGGGKAVYFCRRGRRG
ncbi:ATP-binding protein [Spongiactinospora rosea]|uniref:ATP-binding protein n=1 Tax=Spongiactinospora rosea TaxID=2248750 RepID=A0A366M771_9ACTN|nr:ATP-binding protein [Spongiactinospora rosea]RBQ21444.1 ATP-binding protein [Spongiactinospora rosea]